MILIAASPPTASVVNADSVRAYVLKLRKFRDDVKRERNDFVRACNKLGLQYENKSTLEQEMVCILLGVLFSCRLIRLPCNKPGGVAGQVGRFSAEQRG